MCCSATFSHSNALELHFLIHTGQKPHNCKLCTKSFAQLPHLKKHMRCIHNTDKPYYCEICEEYFKIKTEYEDHVEKNHVNEISENLDGSRYFLNTY